MSPSPSSLAGRAARLARTVRFPGSADYWERRYASGGTSGPGSYGEVAAFKADTLNEFVRSQNLEFVVEFGCGDGNQLAYADYPRYLGLDVSPRAVAMCIDKFREDPTKSFIAYDPRHFQNRGAIVGDLTLSLDVIYHLIEDDVYQQYMRDVFRASSRFVAIFAVDEDQIPSAAHVRYRKFSSWVASQAPDWTPIRTVSNPHTGPDSQSSFYFYEKQR